MLVHSPGILCGYFYTVVYFLTKIILVILESGFNSDKNFYSQLKKTHKIIYFVTMTCYYMSHSMTCDKFVYSSFIVILGNVPCHSTAVGKCH